MLIEPFFIRSRMIHAAASAITPAPAMSAYVEGSAPVTATGAATLATVASCTAPACTVVEAIADARGGGRGPANTKEAVGRVSRDADLIALIAAKDVYSSLCAAVEKRHMALPAALASTPEHHHIAGPCIVRSHLLSPFEIAAGGKGAGALQAAFGEHGPYKGGAPGGFIIGHGLSGFAKVIQHLRIMRGSGPFGGALVSPGGGMNCF